MWNVLIFEPFSGAGSLTVGALDSGPAGLLGFMVSPTLETGSTEANDRVHTAGTAAGRTRSMEYSLKQLQAGDVPVRRMASLERARAAAMVAEVVEISDGKSVCRGACMRCTASKTRALGSYHPIICRRKSAD